MELSLDMVHSLRCVYSCEHRAAVDSKSILNLSLELDLKTEEWT